MSQHLVAKSEARDYRDLFIYDLNWGAPDIAPVTVHYDDGSSFTATNVASQKGLRVWEVPALPGTSVEAQIDREIAKSTTNRLVIFHEPARQAWRWPSRSSKGDGVVSRPARHVHRTGVADPRFGEKLQAIRLPEDAVLDANAVLAKVRAAFDVETTNESKRASKLMARMYAAIERAYPDGCDPKARDHEISVSLARVLFLLFGDDTDMWTARLFQDFIKHQTARDGSDIGQQLNELFSVLDKSPSDRIGLSPELAALPYVNGGIFEEPITLPDLDHEFRDAVLDASAVDWSTISPAIFGSMFQSVRDAQTRRELGEHYTSEENILKTLNPLFLDELRAEFDAAIARDTPKKKQNALEALWARLGRIRYVDPACGCGNFIIVAYRELRELELRIMDALTTILEGEDAQVLETDWTHTLKVTLDHFYGIELDEWPARIAETAMFLVDRQCDLRMRERFGVAPERLPISLQANITVGSALRHDWRELLGEAPEIVLGGNPPFRGGLKLLPDQQSDRTYVYDHLPAAHGLRTGRIDFVCAWFAKAAQLCQERPGARAAFVATNSITQGEQARVMGPLMERQGMVIDFAHQTFEWTSEAPGKAAVVHVVIIGFSKAGRRSGPTKLFRSGESSTAGGLATPSINWWLAAAPHVDIVPRRTPLVPGLPRMTVGSQPTDGGHLLATPDTVGEIQADPIASRYLRRYMGAEEMMSGAKRWCLWLADAPASDLQGSEVLRRRIEAVAEGRRKSPTKSFRETPPHLFTHRKHPGMEYLALPQNSTDARRWIPAAVFNDYTVASNKATIIYPASHWMLGLLQSQMYQTWVRLIGGRLKSDPTITADLSFNSFPWPELPRQAKQALEAHTEVILNVRDQYPELSLGQLYDLKTMPQDLEASHLALDVVVDGLYGLKDPSDIARGRALFERYRKLTGTGSTVADMLPGSGDELF